MYSSDPRHGAAPGLLRGCDSSRIARVGLTALNSVVMDAAAAKLLNFAEPLDVSLLDATVASFYGASTKEQVRCNPGRGARMHASAESRVAICKRVCVPRRRGRGPRRCSRSFRSTRMPGHGWMRSWRPPRTSSRSFSGSRQVIRMKKGVGWVLVWEVSLCYGGQWLMWGPWWRGHDDAMFLVP